MKDNTSNDERPVDRQEIDIEHPHFDIDVETLLVGGWLLGFANVAMMVNGERVNALALYAERNGGIQHRRIVQPRLKEAIGFMEDSGVPPKVAGMFLAEIADEAFGGI